ncbi:MAG: hypothetical protein IJB90_02405 [Clostridia bacterium]|nr:hypothetical protein [Clostridia bacterium]
MSTENMKNMVVLKDLPSNIVDEAIVILKPNVKLKSLDFAENKKENKNVKNSVEQNSKKYIINEAEMVLSNYLSKIESENKSIAKVNKKIENKYKRVRAISIFLGIMLFLTFLIK